MTKLSNETRAGGESAGLGHDLVEALLEVGGEPEL
jgi:hypothetical protein